MCKQNFDPNYNTMTSCKLPHHEIDRLMNIDMAQHGPATIARERGKERIITSVTMLMLATASKGLTQPL